MSDMNDSNFSYRSPFFTNPCCSGNDRVRKAVQQRHYLEHFLFEAHALTGKQCRFARILAAMILPDEQWQSTHVRLIDARPLKDTDFAFLCSILQRDLSHRRTLADD